MMDFRDPSNLDLWQVIGSVIGSGLAFVFLWPTSRKDFWRMMTVSLIGGMILAPIARNYFGWPDLPRFWLASSMVCATFAWVAFGAGFRILKAMDKMPK